MLARSSGGPKGRYVEGQGNALGKSAHPILRAEGARYPAGWHHPPCQMKLGKLPSRPSRHICWYRVGSARRQMNLKACAAYPEDRQGTRSPKEETHPVLEEGLAFAVSLSPRTQATLFERVRERVLWPSGGLRANQRRLCPTQERPSGAPILVPRPDAQHLTSHPTAGPP